MLLVYVTVEEYLKYCMIKMMYMAATIMMIS